MSPASLGPHVARNERTKLALSPDNPQVPAGGQPECGGSADRPGGLGRFEEAESGEPPVCVSHARLRREAAAGRDAQLTSLVCAQRVRDALVPSSTEVPGLADVTARWWRSQGAFPHIVSRGAWA